MPRLATAFLCFAAEERGGVVSVLSAFVNQLAVPSLPARAQITVVANVEILDSDFDQAHVFVIAVNFEDGENLARVEMPTPAWPRPMAIDPSLPVNTSLIMPLGLDFRRAGIYWVSLTIDGEEVFRKPYKVSVTMPQL